ncbi:MAG: hypothetical protein Q4D56_08080 [Bacteroides sp.]|nr:hypothetical protein [Bacteroides sp.]
MKFNYCIYSLIASVLMVFAACTPDEYEMGKKTYASEDLVQGLAFTVTPDASDPNTIHLQSLLSGVTPLWETPSGRSQATSLDLELPFEGEYEVTFGVETPGGVVYGAPYTFTVVGNNFNMLSDEKWSNLAGGVGKTRKWVPIDKDYGIGRCTGPIMYMNPDDVKNDGSGSTDLIFGSDNWAPNWDPGIQSWLVPEGDPYFDSYMTFGLDAANGCTAEVFRNDASGGTLMNGKFTLNLSDSKRPNITFTDCYSLHNAGFDEVCSNYTQEIKIIELTPYLLQIATMRTNSEGAWWIIWNFISEEAKNDPSIIPSDDIDVIEPSEVQLPTIEDLETKLFTTDINGVTYVGNEMRFLINDEEPYDWMWWNGGSSAWESVVNGNYGTTWAPAAGSEIEDFELVLSKSGDTYKWDDGTNSGNLIIGENTLTFTDSSGNPAEVTFLTATGDSRTVEVKGSEFTVLACDAASSLQIGVPSSTNAKGDVNTYLCVNLDYKPVSDNSGPTEIAVDASKVEVIFGDGNSDRLRLQFYNSWGGANECLDITKVKLKKNQVLTIQYKVLSGITWNEGAAPKTVIMENKIGNSFEDDCYNLSYAANFDTTAGATQTVTLTNTTSSTVTFETDCCLVVGIQNKGLATVEMNEDGSPNVTIDIVSMTIE